LLLKIGGGRAIRRTMARTVQMAAPPRRRDFLLNRETLLRHARRLIAERGPEALTVSEVAHRARLNRTTAYQHFRTRDELVAAVMGGISEELSAILATPRPITEHVDQVLGFFVEHPEIGRLSLHHLLAENPFPRQGWERYVGELEQLVTSRPGQEDVDVEMLAVLMISAALIWSVHVRVRHDDVAGATERFAREMKRLLLHGLSRPERGRAGAAATPPQKPQKKGPKS
jgi:AcrR family transcriptional regulator